MRLFSKLFGTSGETTRLQRFVESISPRSIQRSSESLSESSMPATTAVSLSVLMAACRFQQSLTKTIEGARKATSATSASTPYDVVVFEAAAFCHYQLLAQYLVIPDEDEDEWEAK